MMPLSRLLPCAFFFALIGGILLLTSCDATRHIPTGNYLLRSNEIQLHSDRSLTNRGELNDALSSLIIQKPNTYFFGVFPYKVWLYNLRYRKYQHDTAAEKFQLKLKTVERPAVYDSALADRSVQHMNGFLFNQGYFYAQVSDTLLTKKRKARVVYRVNTGLRYLIHRTTLDIDDSTVKAIVAESMSQSPLTEGAPFAMSVADQERNRIATVLRNHGYYKFTAEMVHIEADTFNKVLLQDVENPFEGAINFLAQQKAGRKPTVDLSIRIRAGEERNAYRRYRIGKLRIYPDFVSRSDVNDSTMQERTIGDATFRYHHYYVHERVLLNHIFLQPGQYFTQDGYDKTITKLNELGLFQYVQIYMVDDSTLPADRSLRVIILMNPVKRYDFSAGFDVTHGQTYSLGTSIGLNFRNRNLGRGANQLSVSLNGGIEMGYDSVRSKPFLDRFYLLSRSLGVNATLDFPKFIAPDFLGKIIKPNQTHTLIGVGSSLMDRVNYFTLINTAVSLGYNWKPDAQKTWEFSPLFANVLRLPNRSALFQALLDSNAFLRNSYQEILIEGENLYFTYSNQNSPTAQHHSSYLRAGVEEAGALLGLVNAAIDLNRSLGLRYSQYVRMELDARHYIRRRHSELATRFFAGVGVPYDKSSVLPYVKQYFVGGPYSLRGWRVRQLGPGSYQDSSSNMDAAFIDRTGDIKMEANAEFRFDMVPLFGGSLHINGAVFIDAGNIWLAKPSKDYPGGDFHFGELGHDLAVNTGFGLRVDIASLFVIRADWGIPIKQPGTGPNGGWVFDEIQPGNRDWRARYLMPMIAIGYPF